MAGWLRRMSVPADCAFTTPLTDRMTVNVCGDDGRIDATGTTRIPHAYQMFDDAGVPACRARASSCEADAGAVSVCSRYVHTPADTAVPEPRPDDRNTPEELYQSTAGRRSDQPPGEYAHRHIR